MLDFTAKTSSQCQFCCLPVFLCFIEQEQILDFLKLQPSIACYKEVHNLLFIFLNFLINSLKKYPISFSYKP